MEMTKYVDFYVVSGSLARISGRVERADDTPASSFGFQAGFCHSLEFKGYQAEIEEVEIEMWSTWD